MPRTMQRLAILMAAGIAGGLAFRALLRRSRRISFRDRVVLITGGSRGLGLVLARELAHAGARLAICARDVAELTRAQAELGQIAAEVFVRVCDVTRQDEVKSLVQNVEAALGPIDVLINNAGIICVGPTETMTIEDYKSALETHLWGPLYTIQSVLPSMRRRGQGRIVNIASIGGKISVPHLVPYCASKFALVGLSQGMRAELAKDGILVTTVNPGLMRTGSPRHAMFKSQHRAEYTWFSISASWPPLSISAERAARKIINACRYGDAELVISVPAKMAVLLNSLAPQLIAEVMAVGNRLLPGPNDNTEALKGFESESALSPSWLTVLNERAAYRNNEVRHARPK
jgi:NAD(P)-dependent dehydrogenase (short-subunit alcohol dehydrogenase family)